MFKRDTTILKEKLKESLASVAPITAVVFALCFFVVPVPSGILMAFIIGASLLVAGMGLFTLGADLAMTPIGERIGSDLPKSRKLWFVIAASFVAGAIITVSEPDLQVLAQQTPGVPNAVLICAVALGVGVFLVAAMLRILFKIKLAYLLIGFYTAIFILTLFAPREYIAVAFDSGGVTTGPMTVPFIMALGVGVAATRSDADAEADSFGLVALCSIGPILAVLLLGIFFPANSGAHSAAELPSVENSRELALIFARGFPEYFKEVAVSLLPIALFFAAFQIWRLKLNKERLIKICVGIGYTYLGLVLFLTGVNVGFMPAGNYIGRLIGALDNNWIIVPVGMLIGYFIVAAEPAVHVLNKQVFEITAGAIPKKAMSVSLAVGVSISVGLAMLRIIAGIPILLILIPGYALAALLTFFAPPIFTAIAFDSGGVASGPMTATFLLPLAMGLCSATGGDVATDAFGVVAVVAMTPLITIQLLGLYFKLKTGKKQQPAETEDETGEEIITLNGGTQ